MASGIRTTRQHVDVAYKAFSPGIRVTREHVDVAYVQPRSPGIRATRAVVEVAYAVAAAAPSDDEAVLIIVE